MINNIKAGANVNSDDGGYSIGTQEKYEEFVKLRNGTMTPMEKLMYDSGLTAQGCWDQMDSYDKEAIMKFAELIVRECEKSIKSVPTHFEAQDKIIVECLKSIRETFRS